MGAASVLGNVAAGVHGAYEADMQRQFADELDRRRQLGDFLDKIATDESARPESRQAAVSERVRMFQTPFHKPYKFDPNVLIAPRTPAQTNASFTPGATPGTVQPPIPQPTAPPVSSIGGMPTPAGVTGAAPTPPPDLVPPQGASGATFSGTGVQPVVGAQVTPGQEPGVFKTPDVLAAEKAHAAGTQTSAQIQAQIDARMKVFTDIHDSLIKQGVEPGLAAREANIQAAVALGHPLPYGAVKPSTGRQAKIFDPADPTKTMNVTPIFNPMDQSVQYVSDRGVIEDPKFVPPGWTAPKTTTKTGKDALGFTSSSTSTTQSPTPTPPPGSTTAPATKSAATVSTKAPTGVAPATPAQGRALKVYNGLTDTGKAAVDSAADGFIRNGWKPGAKLDKTQSLAEQILKEQGVDIPTMATAGAMGQADVAKMIQPLITRARELIAANPDALGPLAGRWSELSQKFGNLSGPPKELAGTLTSIYSLAGKLHGWRAIKVADEFRKTYGDLSNTPESLNSGLDAMLGTTKAIIGVAYPGSPTAPPSSPHPQTHVFDSKAWATANPQGDVNAAIAAAKAQNYEVK